MRRAISWALVGGLLLGALPAAAKEEAAEQRPRAKQHVDFGEGLVDGTVEGPAGQVVWGAPRVKFIPQIPVRLDFQRELSRSTDEL